MSLGVSMSFGPSQRVAFAAFVLAATLAAQRPSVPAAPRFDVVSIRVVPLNTPPTMREQDFTPILPGGRYVDSRTGLYFLIPFAYNIEESDRRLVGLPNWAKNESYSISARPADGFPALSPNENREQVRLMVRAMLADRFHLQLHTETRQESVMNLVVDKGGLRIKEVPPPVPPEKEGVVNAAVGDRSGRMIANKATMAGMARALPIFLKQTVVDQTGLKGYYTFDVHWTEPEKPGEPPPTPGLGTEGQALLIRNLQDQFGLRLTKTTGPVEYWIVDHVEPPGEN
jgi:uncharacterized protein (TIGR03435 family)